MLYNRGLFNAVIVAEAIATAQKMTGKTVITGADMRMGLENFDLSEARLTELGLSKASPVPSRASVPITKVAVRSSSSNGTAVTGSGFPT